MALRDKHEPTKRKLDQILDGLEELEVFEKGRCVSPKECGARPAILVAIRIGDHIAIGLYCLDHRRLMEIMLALAEKEVKNGNAQRGRVH